MIMLGVMAMGEATGIGCVWHWRFGTVIVAIAAITQKSRVSDLLWDARLSKSLCHIRLCGVTGLVCVWYRK